jgi:hypothetical protein
MRWRTKRRQRRERRRKRKREVQAISEAVRGVEAKVGGIDDTIDDPKWHMELQKLRQVLGVLQNLSRKIESPQDFHIYGPYLLLLPGWRLTILSGLLQILLGEFPKEIETLIDIRQQLMSELGTVIEEVESRIPEEEKPLLASVRVGLADVAAREVLSDAAAVSEAKTAQQEAAGDVAESELAKWFAAYEKQQTARAIYGSAVPSY